MALSDNTDNIGAVVIDKDSYSIRPNKTNNITKIKGWRKKKFNVDMGPKGNFSDCSSVYNELYSSENSNTDDDSCNSADKIIDEVSFGMLSKMNKVNRNTELLNSLVKRVSDVTRTSSQSCNESCSSKLTVVEKGMESEFTGFTEVSVNAAQEKLSKVTCNLSGGLKNVSDGNKSALIRKPKDFLMTKHSTLVKHKTQNDLPSPTNKKRLNKLNVATKRKLPESWGQGFASKRRALSIGRSEKDCSRETKKQWFKEWLDIFLYRNSFEKSKVNSDRALTGFETVNVDQVLNQIKETGNLSNSIGEQMKIYYDFTNTLYNCLSNPNRNQSQSTEIKEATYKERYKKLYLISKLLSEKDPDNKYVQYVKRILFDFMPILNVSEIVSSSHQLSLAKKVGMVLHIGIGRSLYQEQVENLELIRSNKSVIDKNFAEFATSTVCTKVGQVRTGYRFLVPVVSSNLLTLMNSYKSILAHYHKFLIERYGIDYQSILPSLSIGNIKPDALKRLMDSDLSSSSSFIEMVRNRLTNENCRLNNSQKPSRMNRNFNRNIGRGGGRRGRGRMSNRVVRNCTIPNKRYNGAKKFNISRSSCIPRNTVDTKECGALTKEDKPSIKTTTGSVGEVNDEDIKETSSNSSIQVTDKTRLSKDIKFMKIAFKNGRIDRSMKRLNSELKRLNHGFVEVDSKKSSMNAVSALKDIGVSDLIPEDDNRLAKVESQFHQTIMKADDDLVVLSSFGERSKRTRKPPDKLADIDFPKGRKVKANSQCLDKALKKQSLKVSEDPFKSDYESFKVEADDESFKINRKLMSPVIACSNSPSSTATSTGYGDKTDTEMVLVQTAKSILKDKNESGNKNVRSGHITNKRLQSYKVFNQANLQGTSFVVPIDNKVPILKLRRLKMHKEPILCMDHYVYNCFCLRRDMIKSKRGVAMKKTGSYIKKPGPIKVLSPKRCPMRPSNEEVVLSDDVVVPSSEVVGPKIQDVRSLNENDFMKNSPSGVDGGLSAVTSEVSKPPMIVLDLSDSNDLALNQYTFTPVNQLKCTVSKQYKFFCVNLKFSFSYLKFNGCKENAHKLGSNNVLFYSELLQIVRAAKQDNLFRLLIKDGYDSKKFNNFQFGVYGYKDMVLIGPYSLTENHLLLAFKVNNKATTLVPFITPDKINSYPTNQFVVGYWWANLNKAPVADLTTGKFNEFPGSVFYQGIKKPNNSDKIFFNGTYNPQSTILTSRETPSSFYKLVDVIQEKENSVIVAKQVEIPANQKSVNPGVATIEIPGNKKCVNAGVANVEIPAHKKCVNAVVANVEIPEHKKSVNAGVADVESMVVKTFTGSKKLLKYRKVSILSSDKVNQCDIDKLKNLKMSLPVERVLVKTDNNLTANTNAASKAREKFQVAVEKSIGVPDVARRLVDLTHDDSSESQSTSESVKDNTAIRKRPIMKGKSLLLSKRAENGFSNVQLPLATAVTKNNNNGVITVDPSMLSSNVVLSKRPVNSNETKVLSVSVSSCLPKQSKEELLQAELSATKDSFEGSNGGNGKSRYKLILPKHPYQRIFPLKPVYNLPTGSGIKTGLVPHQANIVLPCVVGNGSLRQNAPTVVPTSLQSNASPNVVNNVLLFVNDLHSSKTPGSAVQMSSMKSLLFSNQPTGTNGICRKESVSNVILTEKNGQLSESSTQESNNEISSLTTASTSCNVSGRPLISVKRFDTDTSVIDHLRPNENSPRSVKTSLRSAYRIERPESPPVDDEDSSPVATLSVTCSTNGYNDSECNLSFQTCRNEDDSDIVVDCEEEPPQKSKLKDTMVKMIADASLSNSSSIREADDPKKLVSNPDSLPNFLESYGIYFSNDD